jgi:hypothetical protein
MGGSGVFWTSKFGLRIRWQFLSVPFKWVVICAITALWADYALASLSTHHHSSINSVSQSRLVLLVDIFVFESDAVAEARLSAVYDQVDLVVIAQIATAGSGEVKANLCIEQHTAKLARFRDKLHFVIVSVLPEMPKHAVLRCSDAFDDYPECLWRENVLRQAFLHLRARMLLKGSRPALFLVVSITDLASPVAIRRLRRDRIGVPNSDCSPSFYSVSEQHSGGNEAPSCAIVQQPKGFTDERLQGLSRVLLQIDQVFHGKVTVELLHPLLLDTGLYPYTPAQVRSNTRDWTAFDNSLHLFHIMPPNCRWHHIP